MKTLIIGANGKMGRRYQAILNYLNQPFTALDIGFEYEKLEELLSTHKKVIVATPTDKHYENVLTICERKPKFDGLLEVLIEKPVSKKLDEVQSLVENCASHSVSAYVVNQYCYTKKSGLFESGMGTTIYNYFHSGNDGIQWDCFQIIALSNGYPILKNTSPIWKCVINGHDVLVSEMDHAYISMIQDFLGPKVKVWGHKKMVDATKKVLSYL